jgi:spore coat polysaccharide biosynthesis protein SpsF
MKNIAIVSARMGSNRFPGKVMTDLWDGKPVLQILIERLKLSKKIDKIVVTTTPEENNNPIIKLCFDLGIDFVYGHKEEALQSVCEAVKQQRIIEADELNVIDITGDCPFIDPFQIDEMLTEFVCKGYHYLSNCMVRSFPIGFDIQIYRDSLLILVNEIVKNKSHRVHSGWNIWAYSSVIQKNDTYGYVRPLKFGNIVADEKYNYPDWRVVLDYPEDLKLLKILIGSFARINFTYQEIIDFLKVNPELLKININCKQKIPGKDE